MNRRHFLMGTTAVLATHAVRGLASGPNQYRGLTGLDSGNDSGTSDGCDLGIVDLIDDFPRKVLAAAIGQVSRNQEAIPAASGKSNEPRSDFEGCHLCGRYIAERRALLYPRENCPVIF